MNKLMNAIKSNDMVTENGMPTHSTAGSAMVDFFYNMGALRTGKTVQLAKGLDLFQRAYAEQPQVALKVLFYLRDIRNGMGERALFRHIYRWLIQHQPQVARRNMVHFGEFGRYDDLTIALNTDVQHTAATVWINALNDPKTAGLAAKWAPRKGPWFGILRRAGGFTSATAFRKFLVKRTKVVETLMCQNEWPAIDYEQVPSQANLLYRKAFSKHDGVRYTQFIQDAKTGKVKADGTKTKMNSATLYPHQIAQKVLQYGADTETLEALWNNLPNVFGDKAVSILPVCDVSGSMAGEPMDVAVGLGLYLAERNNGAFKNILCAFSERPGFLEINPRASLLGKMNAVLEMPWGMSTNLEAVFKLMLAKARHGGCSNEDMPKMVLIISDMQFDQCVESPSSTALTMMQQQYAAAGYEMPSVVFWNVRASNGIPAKYNQKGVALVSGFSPNIMKGIISGKLANPIDTVLDTVLVPRYERIQ